MTVPMISLLLRLVCNVEVLQLCQQAVLDLQISGGKFFTLGVAHVCEVDSYLWRTWFVLVCLTVHQYLTEILYNWKQA